MNYIQTRNDAYSDYRGKQHIVDASVDLEYECGMQYLMEFSLLSDEPV